MQEAKLLGHVAWDGSTATSDRVLLRAAVINRRFVERNQYVRIQDEEGARAGFLAKIVTGPFFHRSGSPTVGGLTASSSVESFLLAEMEVQSELVRNRARDTNSRPAPGTAVYTLSAAEIADLHGFRGDMLLGNVTGQDDLAVYLQSNNKAVLPRNLGIFGTVGSGKSNTSQVIIEEAARAAVLALARPVELARRPTARRP
jgi:uncharacterized protein